MGIKKGRRNHIGPGGPRRGNKNGKREKLKKRKRGGRKQGGLQKTGTKDGDVLSQQRNGWTGGA